MNEQFLSTPSARRATSAQVPTEDEMRFLSTPSARRATAWSMTSSTSTSNFYPRPLRGGRLSPFLSDGQPDQISIHALCEEGDECITR